MKAVVFDKVDFSFDGVDYVLQNFSLAIEDGSITGFLGPNGTGKSTIMSLIAGYIRPNKGSIYVYGEDISKKGAKKKLSKIVGFAFQNMEFDEPKPVWKLLKKVRKSSYRDRREIPDIEELLFAFDLIGIKDKRVINLSKGEMQRVILAFMVAFAPRIMLLDEPVFAIKREEAITLLEKVNKYARQYGSTLIISLHDIFMLKKVVEYIVMFNYNMEIIEGKTDDVFNKENLERVYNTNYENLKQEEYLSMLGFLRM